jgi:S1-C subfamily serine protease
VDRDDEGAHPLGLERRQHTVRWICVAAAALLLLVQAASYQRAGGFLGVTVGALPADSADTLTYNGQGVRVAGVLEGSGAHRAGIRRRDVIVAVDGMEVVGLTELDTVLGCYSPGDRVAVKLWRGGRLLTVTTHLDERPAVDGYHSGSTRVPEVLPQGYSPSATG